MINLKQFEVWFVTGSQHLYGPETWNKWRSTLKPLHAS
jgi:L-arabinose isomerase